MKKFAIRHATNRSLSKALPAALITAVAMLVANGVFANPISVANASFEQLPVPTVTFGCGLGCSWGYSTTATLPGWNGGGAGWFRPGVSSGNFSYFNSVPDGITVAYVGAGGISQTVGTVAQAGVTYTLQVDLGWRKDIDDPGFIRLDVGDHITIGTGISPGLFSGNWATYTASYTATAADAGRAITVDLLSSRQQGDFDNVRLSDNLTTLDPNVVPEPASLALLGLGALLFAWRRRAGT